MQKRGTIVTEATIIILVLVLGGIGGFFFIQNNNPFLNQITGRAGGPYAPDCNYQPDGCYGGGTDPPWYCLNGVAVERCVTCGGCNAANGAGEYCLLTEECVDGCSDGTPVDDCTAMGGDGIIEYCKYTNPGGQPDSGGLVSLVQSCDGTYTCDVCPEGYDCISDVCWENTTLQGSCGDATCDPDETCGNTNDAPECNIDCGSCVDETDPDSSPVVLKGFKPKPPTIISGNKENERNLQTTGGEHTYKIDLTQPGVEVYQQPIGQGDIIRIIKDGKEVEIFYVNHLTPTALVLHDLKDIPNTIYNLEPSKIYEYDDSEVIATYKNFPGPSVQTLSLTLVVAPAGTITETTQQSPTKGHNVFEHFSIYSLIYIVAGVIILVGVITLIRSSPKPKRKRKKK